MAFGWERDAGQFYSASGEWERCKPFHPQSDTKLSRVRQSKIIKALVLTGLGDKGFIK